MPALHRITTLGLPLLAALAAPPAHALVAFDNFGASPGFDPLTGVIVSGSQGAFGTRAAGLQFVADATGTLQSISIAASARNSGRPNDGLRLTLTTDDSDFPGESLASVVLNDVCYLDIECPFGMVHTAMASSEIELEEGTTYWIIGTADLALADFTWYLTSAIAPGLVYVENGLIGAFLFESPPALKVTVIPDGGGGEVSEPALPFLLLFGALAGISTGSLARRRQSASLA